jgi:hypothetical protein
MAQARLTWQRRTPALVFVLRGTLRALRRTHSLAWSWRDRLHGGDGVDYKMRTLSDFPGAAMYADQHCLAAATTKRVYGKITRGQGRQRSAPPPSGDAAIAM